MTLLGDFGPVVCKFGPDTLKPVLTQIIDGLLQQTPEQLARLPQLADTMANLDPKALAVSHPAPPPRHCQAGILCLSYYSLPNRVEPWLQQCLDCIALCFILLLRVEGGGMSVWPGCP